MIVIILAVGIGAGIGATHPAKVKALGHRIGCLLTLRHCSTKLTPTRAPLEVDADGPMLEAKR